MDKFSLGETIIAWALFSDASIDNNEFFYARSDLVCGIFCESKDSDENIFRCLVDKSNISKRISELKDDTVLYRLISGYAENIRKVSGKFIFDFKYATEKDRFSAIIKSKVMNKLYFLSS